MIPWKFLGSTITPDKKSELKLYQRDSEFSIRVNGQELMNSRMSGSEKKLAELSCCEVADREKASVLIGGLGMGYTLSAALKSLNSDAEVTISELVPAVVEWNKEVLGHLADFPLEDSRVTVLVEDVVEVIKNKKTAYDAILLDVDNGPDGLTQEGNENLYSFAGLSIIKSALKPGGVLAIWSASPDKRFTDRLKKSSFHVEEKKERARSNQKGAFHTIWLAKKK